MKMAATGSARSVRGLGQKCKARPADMLRQTRTPSQLLTLDEARCPVCSEILLEPVTMPCSHSVCLYCFKRTVEFTSLCCPLCRLRVSSWARKQSREKSLVNMELGEMVRKSYPERCQKRMEQTDTETSGEEIFRLPAQVSKPGETLPDNVKQKIKFYGLLSDSENEEPIGKRTRNVSAFVRRTKNSAAFTRDGTQTNVGQRSQSCTDTEEGRRKIKVPSHLPGLDKATIAQSYNAGILLSSENSRSLSAPIIVQEKRHSWRGVVMATSTPFTVPQSKQERSISPESNDSISEELNHFKPIVCSPCTPPKRLPDGRVMEPTIVKSTPRNLIRSLQRPTNYEASPTILQKWKQIENKRGKKRRQKTKHLEETESGLKRPRSQSQDVFNLECAQADLNIQQVQQEREDRELALSLQRQFDMEQQIADKQKKSPDKYFLRSWVSSDSRIECSPRRSGRISQKNKHLNCNY
ncbi:hypothetical protein UPYG_G00197540 [Umbra pygmaea]|uniref:RING-type E3 ubiquitin transferase n=1 Tax=Umbra pygmaea TaxID=75934 RepID=A0ABD0WHH0_UMBPY